MSPDDFTFLNTTGRPRLSQLAAKRMRAHITKSNFAKRRQRIAHARSAEPKPNGVAADEDSQDILIRGKSSGATLVASFSSQLTDLYHYAQFRKFSRVN
jgi:hypothetical protein